MVHGTCRPLLTDMSTDITASQRSAVTDFKHSFRFNRTKSLKTTGIRSLEVGYCQKMASANIDIIPFDTLSTRTMTANCTRQPWPLSSGSIAARVVLNTDDNFLSWVRVRIHPWMQCMIDIPSVCLSATRWYCAKTAKRIYRGRIATLIAVTIRIMTGNELVGSMVMGFQGRWIEWMALFPVTSNPTWRQAAILDNFEWPYLRNGSFDPLI